MNTSNRQQGIIKEIIIIVVAVFALNYIGFDVKEFLDSPQIKSAFDATWSLFQTVWADYIKEPIFYVWDTIIMDVVWEQWLKQFFNK
ncbi:MAG: hypothetical protein KAR00_03315 [Candidatus Pacebacteria bacterium]|nr:hypothetical protein [Candidatus Paceibacterota bacterium]